MGLKTMTNLVLLFTGGLNAVSSILSSPESFFTVYQPRPSTSSTAEMPLSTEKKKSKAITKTPRTPNSKATDSVKEQYNRTHNKHEVMDGSGEARRVALAEKTPTTAMEATTSEHVERSGWWRRERTCEVTGAPLQRRERVEQLLDGEEDTYDGAYSQATS
ncbi:hypothetical protein PIB30_033330 [Stylosanthes scabra]|uniref:Uncharacterized protein n=1 Tax=Stylosanthes scabra TaxID=79078 RepID=A0ABU6VEN3_9FABA|nr:hypothetical protein [Stylosanthes scabra]